MADFDAEWFNEWLEYSGSQQQQYSHFDETPFHHVTDGNPLPGTEIYSTPSSSDTLVPPHCNKRRYTSESPESDNPVPAPKKARKKACFYCKKKRKTCEEGNDSEGACMPCLKFADKMGAISGLLRPLCWKPQISNAEIFRRGPTIRFAASLRGHKEDAKPGKQDVWDRFAVVRAGKEPSKTIELSQNWTSKTLNIELDQYRPKETDKQYYSWYDNGVEKRYKTPAYGITNSRVTSSTIEKFLQQNFEGYIDSHLRNATKITQRTFQTALRHTHLPLVDRALKLWVGCRFIEEPWSIVGAESLGMSQDPNPECPYYARIPVPPIVDLQIDCFVINDLLQPELTKISKMLKEMLWKSNSPWKDWFEIYLAYFILLHNVELTMAHDAWFVKRNKLETKYSNKTLVEIIMQGATTLLTCFHYAHQGYEPFSNRELEKTGPWTEEQKGYIKDIRVMLGEVRGDHVQDPAKELFWTSQLHKPDWRPVVIC